MTDVGKHIAEYRKCRKMTQDDLAQRMHVSRQTVSSWETGRTLPDINMLSLTAEALEVGVEQLIYGRSVDKGPRNTLRYKTLAAVTGAIVTATIIGLQVIVPYLRNTQGNYRFNYRPELLYYSVLQPIVYILGAVCLLSLISILADISIRNHRIRLYLLCFGVFSLLAFAYFVLVVYSFLPGWKWIYYFWSCAAKVPVVFFVPGGALYFGLLREK